MLTSHPERIPPTASLDSLDAYGVGFSQPKEHPLTYPLYLIAACISIYTLEKVRHICIPFVIAVFLMYLLDPVVIFFQNPYRCCRSRNKWWFRLTARGDFKADRVREGGGPSRRGKSRKKRLPRALAVVLTMIFSFTFLALVGLVLRSSIERFEDNLDKYEEEAEELWNSTIAGVHSLGGDFEDDKYLKKKLGEAIEAIAPTIVGKYRKISCLLQVTTSSMFSFNSMR